MCYLSGRLYTIESWKDAVLFEYRLAVYSVTDQDTVTLMDTLGLDGTSRDPRIDGQSGRVYFPSDGTGIHVVRYDGSKLVPIVTLRCVEAAIALAVASLDTLYVCDRASKTVCLVDVTQDRVTARLQNPVEMMCTSNYPFTLSVLGDTVLVRYYMSGLVIYRHGVPTPGKLIPEPPGLDDVCSLHTDHHSSFLLVDGWSNTLYVLDVSGNLTHTISTPWDRINSDCTVVGRELWVGCSPDGIVVMSSQ